MPQTTSPNVSDALYRAAYEFLFTEAEYLDDNEMESWLGLMHEDIEYEVPVRITRERAAGPGFSDSSWHMQETWGSLETRVARLKTDYAWAEDPPSRMRRCVTNIRVSPGDAEDTLNVKSNLLLFRSRFDQTSYQLFFAERRDVLQGADEDWKLRKRVILLDHTTLGTHNLGIFL